MPTAGPGVRSAVARAAAGRKWASSVLPGVLIALLLAVLARVVANQLHPVPEALLALGAGILLRNTLGKWIAPAGAKFVVRYVLRTAIILIGASVTLEAIAARGAGVGGMVVLLVAVAFALGLLLARLAGLTGPLGMLLGAGTAICGATAILVISPIVRAKESETAYAVATIFTFNVIALVLYPIFGHLLRLGQADFGTWAGTAVNDTSVVIATGYTFGPVSGDVATIIKLMRTLLLVPLATLLAVYAARTLRDQTPTSTWRSVRKAVPWFVIGFVALAGLRSTGVVPVAWFIAATTLATFLITVVMGGVGLGVNLRSLVKLGPKPLLVGLALGASMSIISLGAISIGKYIHA